MNETIIKFDKINKIYNNGELAFHALHDISFEIKRGEFVSLFGPSGCGKSSIMNIVGCLAKQTSGDYIFEGVNTMTKNDDELAEMRGKKIGFVFQSFNLLPRINIMKNIELPLLYHGIEPEERIEIIHKVLNDVGLLSKVNRTRAELSGGEQQRVAIARALAMNPDLILADEPTGNLDTKSTKDVLNLLKVLNAKGATILIITHDEDVTKHSDRTIAIRDGRIVADVATASINGNKEER